MATGIKNINRQLDRLEKLFSRKKRPLEPDESIACSDRPATPIPMLAESDATAQIFPEPSFIRPTSSRMMAREEVLLTPRSARRARSLPETPSKPGLSTPATRPSTGSPAGSNRSDLCPSIPSRLSSLGAGSQKRASSLSRGGTKGEPVPELLGFTFPTVPRESNVDPSKRRSRFDTNSLARSSSVSVSPKARADRKRHSTGTQDFSRLYYRRGTTSQQDPAQTISSATQLSQRESHCLGAAAQPHPQFSTPASPWLVSIHPRGPHDSGNDKKDITQKRPSSMSAVRIDNTDILAAMHKSTSLSKLTTPERPDPDTILKEPTVTDFLALSDDDIADGQAALRTRAETSTPPSAFGLPPNPQPASSPRGALGRSKRAPQPLLTLSPPQASRPAAAAAFEAARIATKYHFDLVYVVNLWPSHMSGPSRASPFSKLCGTPVATSPVRATTPSPPDSPVSCASGHDSGFEAGAPRNSLTGRLLAAYGLPSIMYPFRISAPVHQKVLRTRGWLEYRSDSGALDEFARGYSCSFYTGYSPARGRDATSPDGHHRHYHHHQQYSPTWSGAQHSTAKPKPPNRGIVFAAFRLPREDGSPVCSDAEELEALHRDAEALVDMLIEIHMTQRQQRRRAAPGGRRRCVTAGGPGGSGNGGLVNTGPTPLVAM